ncbi:hypothetical protein [Pseudosulfitobacter sp. SM2401]
MCSVLALAACDPNRFPAPDPATHQRQEPSTTEPGVTVSGSVEVGVMKTF